ncbi:MAG: ATP-binding protein [Bradymonadia bacterium]
MSDLLPKVFKHMSAPVWVLNLSDMAFTEATGSALNLWGSTDLQALNSRLKAPSSKMFRARLRSYCDRVADGRVLKEAWTFYPEGRPVKREVTLSGTRCMKDQVFLIGEVLPQAHGEPREGGNLVAAVSHELRTPMHAVVGFLDLLADAGLDEQRGELVDTARGAAEGMIALLDDLLDAAKLASGRLEVERIPMDVWAICKRCCQLVMLSAHRKGLRVNLHIDEDVPRWIMGDPTRLQQVIINLLSNGVKFTERGRVSLHLELSEPEMVVFKVQDTGIGMSPQAVAQIFEAFTQADPTVARRFGGTGLGLSICRELVERMNGQIEVESQEGRGTLFWFTLPAEPADGLTPMPEESPPVADKALSVLVAEDNPVNQRLVRLMLGRMGHDCTLVTDGIAAIEAWRGEGSFDAILMDVQMPKMDGLTASRLLREEGCTLPIVGVTANASPEETRLCLSAGMSVVLGKPYRLSQLAEVLTVHVEGAGTRTARPIFDD